MVEPMEKLTLLFRPAMRDNFLADLQKLGLVHIEQREVEDTPEISRLAARIARIVQHKEFLSSRAALQQEPPQAIEYPGKIDELISRVDLLRVRIEGYQTERTALEREIAAVERWGEFDAERIDALEQHNLRMTFHSAPRATADRIAQQLEADSDRSFVVLFQERGIVFFSVVGPLEASEHLAAASEERLPERSVSVVRQRLAIVETGLRDAFGEVDALMQYRNAMDGRITELQNQFTYKVAVANVQEGGDGHVQFLTGWIPQRLRGGLEEFLQNQETAYIFDRPTAQDDVPVLLHNNGFARLFQPILRIFSLPNYRELDPTAFFAPFYTIFFGLCVADMGYGLFIIVAALVALAVIKRKAARPLLYLGLVLGASVMVAGLLLNDFFGVPISSVWGTKSALAKAVLFGDQSSAMYLAITLGIIQVIFGYVLRTVNEVRQHGGASGLKPIGVVLMLLGAVLAGLPAFVGFVGSKLVDVRIGPIPLGQAIASVPDGSTVGLILVAVGFLLFLFFDNLTQRFYVRPAMGMWHFYEFLTGVMGDILSYMRLFALGLSGGLLGEAVINLAVMVRGHSVWGIIPMVLIFLFGTGLNLAIGLLSAFVHSLRLTFVEFYKSLEFKGGGVEYRPFQLKQTK